MLTAAKLKLQRTCFPVVSPRLDENDGTVHINEKKKECGGKIDRVSPLVLIEGINVLQFGVG